MTIALPISADHAREIAAVICDWRRNEIEPVELAEAVLSDLEGWRPMSFSDSGKESVLAAFERNLLRLEGEAQGWASLP